MGLYDEPKNVDGTGHLVSVDEDGRPSSKVWTQTDRQTQGRDPIDLPQNLSDLPGNILTWLAVTALITQLAKAFSVVSLGLSVGLLILGVLCVCGVATRLNSRYSLTLVGFRLLLIICGVLLGL